jgi:hypothetical protein
VYIRIVKETDLSRKILPGGGQDTKTTATNEVMPPQPLLTLDCHQLVKENEKFVGMILVKDLVVF